MTAIRLDPSLNNNLNKLKKTQDQKSHAHQSQQVVEKIDGLITVYKNGHIDRPQIVPRVGCSLPPELGLSCWDTAIDESTGVWARIYLPNTHRRHHKLLPLLIYFHGGGFCVGSASWSCYHEFLSKLASTASCAVLSVNYRLAPEHRLPTPYEDGEKTLKWLVDQRSVARAGTGPQWLDRCDPSGVFLAGDSAGANIAYNVALRYPSSSLAMKGLILLQPFFGGEARTESEVHTAGQHPRSALTVAASDAYWRMSLPLGANRDHSWCNPTVRSSEDLRRVLRVMVCVAEMDILRDRNFDFCRRLIGGGHTVEQVVCGGVGHAFQILDKSSLSQARVRDLMYRFKNFVSS